MQRGRKAECPECPGTLIPRIKAGELQGICPGCGYIARHVPTPQEDAS